MGSRLVACSQRDVVSSSDQSDGRSLRADRARMARPSLVGAHRCSRASCEHRERSSHRSTALDSRTFFHARANICACDRNGSRLFERSERRRSQATSGHRPEARTSDPRSTRQTRSLSSSRRSLEGAWHRSRDIAKVAPARSSRSATTGDRRRIAGLTPTSQREVARRATSSPNARACTKHGSRRTRTRSSRSRL